MVDKPAEQDTSDGLDPVVDATAREPIAAETATVGDAAAVEDATVVEPAEVTGGGSAAAAGSRARSAPRRGAGVIVGRTVVALVSALALVATGVAWFTVQQFRANTTTTNALAEVNTGTDGDQPSTVAAPPADDGATDILLVGSDSRTDAQGNPLPTSVLTQLRTQFDAGVNTDTIIVLRIPKNGGKAYAISIPRDTWVPIPGVGDGKINGAYGTVESIKRHQLAGSGQSSSAIDQQANEAGQVALIESVQNLTGIHIDHYAEVNLYGFYLLSKAIGGVPVCLKRATSDKDSGADFRAGEQLVSGATALSFVRQRENLPEGDLDRIVRQQVFLAAAGKKILSAGVLTNPSALGALMDAVHKSLVTDPGLDLLSFVQQAQSLVSGNVEFVTVPVVNSNARSSTGQSIVAVDPNQVHQFVAGLVAPTAPATSTSSAAPSTSTAPATTTVAPPVTSTSPTVTTPVPNAPTPPVSIDGVRCVD
ncbi:MAG TPA: LCP family protein [Pseudonocardiaceae bacterium]|jgi:LCP family protein required for cell wall assembly|nr:LCP family protein [Pseudonocardiaceae bacterium]